MPRPEKAVLWKGEVAGRLARVWGDGHTDRMNDAGAWERADDASDIIRACVRQLLSRAASGEEAVRSRPGLRRSR